MAERKYYKLSERHKNQRLFEKKKHDDSKKAKCVKLCVVVWEEDAPRVKAYHDKVRVSYAEIREKLAKMEGK